MAQRPLNPSVFPQLTAKEKFRQNFEKAQIQAQQARIQAEQRNREVFLKTAEKANQEKIKQIEAEQKAKAQAEGKPAPPPVPNVATLDAGQQDALARGGTTGKSNLDFSGLTPGGFIAAASGLATAGGPQGVQAQQNQALEPGQLGTVTSGLAQDPSGIGTMTQTRREVQNFRGGAANAAALIDMMFDTDFSTRQVTEVEKRFATQAEIRQNQAELAVAERRAEAAKAQTLESISGISPDPESAARAIDAYNKDGMPGYSEVIRDLAAQGKLTTQHEMRMREELHAAQVAASQRVEEANRADAKLKNMQLSEAEALQVRGTRWQNYGMPSAIANLSPQEHIQLEAQLSAELGASDLETVQANQPQALERARYAAFAAGADRSGLNGPVLIYAESGNLFGGGSKTYRVNTRQTNKLINIAKDPSIGMEERKRAARLLAVETGGEMIINPETGVLDRVRIQSSANREGWLWIEGRAAAYKQAITAGSIPADQKATGDNPGGVEDYKNPGVIQRTLATVPPPRKPNLTTARQRGQAVGQAIREGPTGAAKAIVKKADELGIALEGFGSGLLESMFNEE